MKNEGKEFLIISRDFVKRYFFLFAAIVLLFLSFMIIKGFLIALASAFVLAYLVKPLQRVLSKHMHRKVSAIVCLGIIILAVLIPAFLLIYGLINQINSILSLTPSIHSNIEYINEYFPAIKDYILSIALGLLKSTFLELPSLLLSLAIALIAAYYIIAEWDFLVKKMEIIIPFKDKKRLRDEVSRLTDNIVYGYIFIAIIEFIVGAIGFYISGVKPYLILPVFIAILAFIPGLGSGTVWIPTALYYLLSDSYFTAIGVMITGVIISLGIDTFMLAKVVGKKSSIHPLIFLLGVMGGVPVFGIFGFIIGPLVLVYSLKLIEESLK